MRHWLAILLLMLLPGEAAADAAQHMRTLAERVLAELTGPMPPEQRRDGVRRLLAEQFDARGTGRFALGRVGRAAAPAERDHFDAALEAWLVAAFAGALEGYGGEILRFGQARPAGDGSQLVPSELQLADGPLLRIDWTLRSEGASWRIADFAIEGIGFAMLLRSGLQAAAERAGGGLGDLLAALGSLSDVAKRR